MGGKLQAPGNVRPRSGCDTGLEPPETAQRCRQSPTRCRDSLEWFSTQSTGASIFNDHAR
jgi:hypothetical protein